MNRSQALHRLESERVRVSHDLFNNQFGGILQPGWRDERLSEVDVVLLALRGDASATEVVQDAISLWKVDVLPALVGLIESITGEWGLVPADTWRDEVMSTMAATETISLLLSLDMASPGIAPESRAENFWTACDTVGRFLVDIRTRSSDFFVRWDPSLVKQD